MLKLLIADGTEAFRMALAEMLRGEYTVRICQEGEETLRLLKAFRPDALVLDLMLPGLDGITLLQRTAEEGIRPVVLATTRFQSEYVLESAAQLGVGYVMIKPCDVRAAAARLRDLTQRIGPPPVTRADPRTDASNLLLRIGMPAKLKGYPCLREALVAAMNDPNQSVTKELYPAVAAICGGNAKQVEHVIRSAINTVWLRRDDKVWGQFFQPGPDGSYPRPTNAEFIFRLADWLNRSRQMGNSQGMIPDSVQNPGNEGANAG